MSLLLNSEWRCAPPPDRAWSVMWWPCLIRRSGGGPQVVPSPVLCAPIRWSDSHEIVAHSGFWTVKVELEKPCMRRNGQIRCQRCAGCLVGEVAEIKV